MKYETLKHAQQVKIITEKLRQYEINHLAVTLDHAAAVASGETEQAADLASQAAKWEQARDAVQAILDGTKQPAAKS